MACAEYYSIWVCTITWLGLDGDWVHEAWDIFPCMNMDGVSLARGIRQNLYLY